MAQRDEQEGRASGTGSVLTANGHLPGVTVMEGVTGRGPQPKSKLRVSDEQRIAERVARVKDVNSILLNNKTQEGYMLSSLLFSFDKVMQRLRRGAGSRVSLDEVQAVILKVDGVSYRMKEVLRRLGVGDAEYRWREPIGDIREREKLAARRDAIVIVPRVQDTARLAPLIRGLDDSLMRLRMESESLVSCMAELKTVAVVILDLHGIIEQGARLTNMPYEARGAVAKLVRQHQEKP